MREFSCNRWCYVTFFLLTRIKSPLKESETSRLSKCISLSWKTGETQDMDFLRRPLEHWKRAGDLLDLIVMDLPTVEWFLHPKLQVCNLMTYTLCVSITNWKVFMTPILVCLRAAVASSNHYQANYILLNTQAEVSSRSRDGFHFSVLFFQQH